uniref:Uncharacterized protein n=1 Tax=Trepomonas sp. PC1 TaxID=1076344 RepID=A0A146K090_9EUKA|eukprot:JAP90342.1 Hypothetical protein TPC1_30163 [Trepomonas sp. PC1]
MTDYITHNWSEYSSRGPSSGSTPLIHLGQTSETTCFFDGFTTGNGSYDNYYKNAQTALLVNTRGCSCGTSYTWGRQYMINMCFLNCFVNNHTFKNCPKVKQVIFESDQSSGNINFVQSMRNQGVTVVEPTIANVCHFLTSYVNIPHSDEFTIIKDLAARKSISANDVIAGMIASNYKHFADYAAQSNVSFTDVCKALQNAKIDRAYLLQSVQQFINKKNIPVQQAFKALVEANIDFTLFADIVKSEISVQNLILDLKSSTLPKEDQIAQLNRFSQFAGLSTADLIIKMMQFKFDFAFYTEKHGFGDWTLSSLIPRLCNLKLSSEENKQILGQFANISKISEAEQQNELIDNEELLNWYLDQKFCSWSPEEICKYCCTNFVSCLAHLSKHNIDGSGAEAIVVKMFESNEIALEAMVVQMILIQQQTEQILGKHNLTEEQLMIYCLKNKIHPYIIDKLNLPFSTEKQIELMIQNSIDPSVFMSQLKITDVNVIQLLLNTNSDIKPFFQARNLQYSKIIAEMLKNNVDVNLFISSFNQQGQMQQFTINTNNQSKLKQTVQRESLKFSNSVALYCQQIIESYDIKMQESEKQCQFQQVKLLEYENKCKKLEQSITDLQQKLNEQSNEYNIKKIKLMNSYDTEIKSLNKQYEQFQQDFSSKINEQVELLKQQYQFELDQSQVQIRDLTSANQTQDELIAQLKQQLADQQLLGKNHLLEAQQKMIDQLINTNKQRQEQVNIQNGKIHDSMRSNLTLTQMITKEVKRTDQAKQVEQVATDEVSLTQVKAELQDLGIKEQILEQLYNAFCGLEGKLKTNELEKFKDMVHAFPIADETNLEVEETRKCFSEIRQQIDAKISDEQLWDAIFEVDEVGDQLLDEDQIQQVKQHLGVK